LKPSSPLVEHIKRLDLARTSPLRKTPSTQRSVIKFVVSATTRNNSPVTYVRLRYLAEGCVRRHQLLALSKIAQPRDRLSFKLIKKICLFSRFAPKVSGLFVGGSYSLGGAVLLFTKAKTPPEPPKTLLLQRLPIAYPARRS